MNHRKMALVTVLTALALDAACGWAFAAAQHIAAWHGLYCALLNAVTVGGDVSPSTPAGYAVNAVEAISVVPLFAATFSLFTSGLTAVHVRRSEQTIRDHISRTVKRG